MKNKLFVARITNTLPANKLRLAIVSLFEYDWFFFQLPIKISKPIRIKKKGNAYTVKSSISFWIFNKCDSAIPVNWEKKKCHLIIETFELFARALFP